MKVILLFSLLTLFSDQSMVSRLNSLRQENQYCSEASGIEKWTIACSIDLRVVFEKARLLDKKSGIYEVQGIVIDNITEEPSPGISIEYGSIEQTLCKIEQYSQTNEKGQFSIQIKINRGKFIQFKSIGFTPIQIELKTEN